VYFGSQTTKNGTRVLTHQLAIVQRTGVNKSVAFARWQHGAAIRLGNATHLVLIYELPATIKKATALQEQTGFYWYTL